MGSYHWPDLECFNAPRYGKRSNHGRKRSGKVREVVYRNGVRQEVVKATKAPSVRAQAAQAAADESAGRDVFVSLSPAIVQVATMDGTRTQVDNGRTSAALPGQEQATRIPSYSERRAAMRERRGY